MSGRVVGMSWTPKLAGDSMSVILGHQTVVYFGVSTQCLVQVYIKQIGNNQMQNIQGMEV